MFYSYYKSGCKLDLCPSLCQRILLKIFKYVEQKRLFLN